MMIIMIMIIIMIITIIIIMSITIWNVRLEEIIKFVPTSIYAPAQVANILV
jgi:hypothetical protein